MSEKKQQPEYIDEVNSLRKVTDFMANKYANKYEELAIISKTLLLLLKYKNEQLLKELRVQLVKILKDDKPQKPTTIGFRGNNERDKGE